MTSEWWGDGPSNRLGVTSLKFQSPSAFHQVCNLQQKFEEKYSLWVLNVESLGFACKEQSSDMPSFLSEPQTLYEFFHSSFLHLTLSFVLSGSGSLTALRASWSQEPHLMHHSVPRASHHLLITCELPLSVQEPQLPPKILRGPVSFLNCQKETSLHRHCHRFVTLSMGHGVGLLCEKTANTQFSGAPCLSTVRRQEADSPHGKG